MFNALNGIARARAPLFSSSLIRTRLLSPTANRQVWLLPLDLLDLEENSREAAQN
jgi:hypothetical protein